MPEHKTNSLSVEVESQSYQHYFSNLHQVLDRNSGSVLDLVRVEKKIADEISCGSLHISAEPDGEVHG